MRSLYSLTLGCWAFLAAPAFCPDAIVALHGNGQFQSIQDAIMAAPQGYPSAARPWVTRIKPGVFRELIYVQRERRFVRLEGEDPLTTIITYNLNANLPGFDGKPIGASRTPTVQVDWESLKLDAFVPAGIGPFPAVIFVHGRGWSRGDKTGGNDPLFATVAGLGMASYTINYHLGAQASLPRASRRHPQRRPLGQGASRGVPRGSGPDGARRRIRCEPSAYSPGVRNQRLAIRVCITAPSFPGSRGRRKATATKVALQAASPAPASGPSGTQRNLRRKAVFYR
jgi:hypothetical protein